MKATIRSRKRLLPGHSEFHRFTFELDEVAVRPPPGNRFVAHGQCSRRHFLTSARRQLRLTLLLRADAYCDPLSSFAFQSKT